VEEERRKKKKQRERGKEREGAKCRCSVVCGRAFWFLSFYYNDISLVVLIISVKQICMFSFVDRDIVYFASTIFDMVIYTDYFKKYFLFKNILK
jgi:hypothetical protein